jgi:hypothetical protein
MSSYGSVVRPVVGTTGRALCHPGQRKDYPLGGIPVEYKGGTVPPPDQRRSYN